MSMHTVHSEIYGVCYECVKDDTPTQADRYRNFLNNHHSTVFANCKHDEPAYNLLKSQIDGNPIRFAEDYDSKKCCEHGVMSLLADIISYETNLDIYPISDDNGYNYCGIFKESVAPWEQHSLADKLQSPNDFKAIIKPYFDELFGNDTWLCGLYDVYYTD